MNSTKKETGETRLKEHRTRSNRRTGEPRRVHNFRLSLAASDKLRKLAADRMTSQGAIIETLVLAAT